jgi:hypothetical protein
VATTHIVWSWGSNTNIDFHADTDILDFGWFQADQFTVSEVNGTVVIAIPSNHQTYTLQHTTLHDLHLSNIAANDASTIGEWTRAGRCAGHAAGTAATAGAARAAASGRLPGHGLVGQRHLHRRHDRDGKRHHLQSQLVDAGQRSRPAQRRFRRAVDHRRRRHLP